MKLLFILSVLTLFLAACSQDPWKAEQIQAQAQADKTRIEAEQLALNQELERQQSEQAYALEMNNRQLDYERRIALEQTVREGWRIFITVIVLAGSAAVVYTILVGTRATVSAYETAAQGVAHAIAQAADIRSRLIYLDDGRQFPALLNGDMITDITTGGVADTTAATAANPQLAAGAIANRHVGIVAKETRRAGKNSESVPLAQNPPVIDAHFSDVKEYFEYVMKKARAHE